MLSSPVSLTTKKSLCFSFGILPAITGAIERLCA
jgi:hypothetical protein